jgi:hypothetical protein
VGRVAELGSLGRSTRHAQKDNNGFRDIGDIDDAFSLVDFVARAKCDASLYLLAVYARAACQFNCFGPEERVTGSSWLHRLVSDIRFDGGSAELCEGTLI